MEKYSIKSLLKAHNVSYLGSVKQSAKLIYSYRHGVLTYGIYLAPADLSGYNVCPKCENCREHCLNGSGQNKIQLLGHKYTLEKARIAKTRWFFEDRRTFMIVLVHEIKRYREMARRQGLGFSVRLNCTSDLSPELFKLDGKNILEIFPDVKFYDYTKVYNRVGLIAKYPNYDLTFSYDGANGEDCQSLLKQGVRCAVVFDGPLPETWWDCTVVSGNEYDMRYMDPKDCVVGLHYHRVVNDYKTGRYVRPNSKFIVATN